MRRKLANSWLLKLLLAAERRKSVARGEGPWKMSLTQNSPEWGDTVRLSSLRDFQYGMTQLQGLSPLAIDLRRSAAEDGKISPAPLDAPPGTETPMPEFTCTTCGQPMQGGECAHCLLAAVANPEHARQAKVTPVTSSDGAIREGEPPVRPEPDEPWHYRHAAWVGLAIGCMPLILFGSLALLTIFAILVAFQMRMDRVAKQTQAINDMKQIAIACHDYHDIHKRLPSPTMVIIKDGKDQQLKLSWRVAILPHIDNKILFDSFDLAAAWDHPNNMPLEKKMPQCYVCLHRDVTEPNRATPIQFFTGPATLFPDNAPRRLQDIPDGSFNTLMLAEAKTSVIWTQPADMVIRPNRPLPLPDDWFFAATADASVRRIVREKTSDEILRQAINPDDQKPNNADW